MVHTLGWGGGVSGQADGERPGETQALDGRRLGAAAVLLGASVLLSRIAGFVREMVLASQVGAGSQTDAYYAAFQIPDLLNYFLAGGALAIAFTPLYLRERTLRGQLAATRLFHAVLGTLGALAALASVGLWLGTDRLVALQFAGFDAPTRVLTAKLTRIVLPGQVFFIVGGILRAVLMAHGRFAAQAVAPLIYNLCIIAGGLIGGSVEGFAWGALVGMLLGPFAYPLYDMRFVGPVRLRFAPFDAGFRRFLWLALPLMLGLSLTTVDEWYGKWFGAAAGSGVVATLGFARRLMMAPVAIVGQAVAAAALPTLSALYVEGRERRLQDTLKATLESTLALAIALSAALFVLAQPLVTLLYQHGRFSAEDGARVASALAILALAIPGWVTQQVAVRAFFARGENWRAMALSSAVALAAVPVYVLLGERFAARGLAAAGALAISCNALATLVWARLRHGGPDLLPLLARAGRALAIASPAALAAHLAGAGEAGSLAAARDLLVGGVLFVAVTLVGVELIGDEAMRRALRRALASGAGRLCVLMGRAGREP